MATSVRVGHPAEEKPGFIEEYVLPQLLLEWVNNTRNRGEQDKISGIAYSSSRIEPGELAFEGAYNIVVPAECPAATGLCSVRIRQFEVSPPVALSQSLSENPFQSAEEIASRLEAQLLTRPYERLPIEMDPGPQVPV